MTKTTPKTIKAHAMTAAELRRIQRRDREFMKRLPGRLAAAIDKDFPNGIQGAVDRSFNED